MAHKRARRKMTNKQALITILCIAAAAVLLIGALIVIGIINKDAVNDPHAGHNHGSELGDGHYEGDGHDHSTDGTAANTDAKVKYQLYQEAGGTYRLSFRDNAGKTVADYKGLTKQPIKATIDEQNGIYELGWATGNGPNDFACVYYNEKTGQVSDKFVAPRGTDGVRIAYGSADQTKIIVQEVFNNKGYHKEHALETPTANKDGDIILGGNLQSSKKSVTISYLAGPDAKKDNRHIIVKLYE